MFKDLIKDFTKNIDKDKVRYNVDENSISVSIGCDLNHLEAEKIRTMIKNENPNYKVCVVHVCTEYSKFIELTKEVINFVKDNLPKEYNLFLAGCDALYYKEFYPELNIISDNLKFKKESYNIPNSKIKSEDKEQPFGVIQIQIGCNNQCSYCAFPKLKGHFSTSKTKKEIVDNIKENTNKGIREIVLTGLNICQYEDPDDHSNLIELLDYIVKSKPSINKISMFSVDPAYDKIFELMDFIEKEPLMSKDLYLATQSGSDNVLKKMNRRHNRKRVEDIINYSKHIKIRHDFIVGHPGETDEDFKQSLSLLRMSQENEIVGGISEFYAHEGTASYYMKDQVDQCKIKERYNIMTNSVNNIIKLIKQEVRCIQFELWHNCTNECEFCYLNGCRKVYTEEQKQASMQKVLDILDTDKIDGFNAVGLIGGELFMGQQENKETRAKFQQIIRKFKTFLDKDQMKEVWLTSNLLTGNLEALSETLEILMKDLPRYQRIMLCTSYDTKGRFHTEEAYKTWYNNLLKIQQMFPRLCIHIQTICNQAFIDEWFENKEKFVDFIDKGFLIDFKPPATNAVDFIYNNTGRETYRANLEKFAGTQSYKYLIDSREKFIDFWRSIAKTFPNGVQKLKDFNTNHVKSECCYSVPWDEWFIDRWDNNKENAPCGHCWDGYCYKDYPNKCGKCDVERLIKELEKSK